MLSRNVLIVDDDTMVINIFKKGFNKAGYTVRRAASAEEALAILERESYPVMFLDLKLPKMSGVDLCRLLRDKYPLTILFAVTGYATQYEIDACRRAGFDDYFTKPVDLKMLFRVTLDAFDRIDVWQKRSRRYE